MRYLLDTNIISEVKKKGPDPNVVLWIEAHEAQLYFSSISIGELIPSPTIN